MPRERTRQRRGGHSSLVCLPPVSRFRLRPSHSSAAASAVVADAGALPACGLIAGCTRQLGSPAACALKLTVAERPPLPLHAETLPLHELATARLLEAPTDGRGRAPWRPPQARLEGGAAAICFGQRVEPRA